MIQEKKIDIPNEESLFEDDEIGELEFVDDLDDIEREEEEDNMGHRSVTSDPEIDGDPDYFYNEKYFE